jgi:hypothetical protein
VAREVSLYNKVVSQDILDKRFEEESQKIAAKSANYFSPVDKVTLSSNTKDVLAPERVTPVNAENSPLPLGSGKINVYI